MKPPDLSIEPIGIEWAEALIVSDASFAERFHIPVEADWSGFEDALPILLEAARAAGPSKWRPALFFDDGVLVGTGGWKGPPEDGVAEMGYAVAPARQGRGIATAVVQRLIEQPRREGVRAVIAHTLAEENASTKVLARCGFTRIAEMTDRDDRPISQWKLNLAAQAGGRSTGGLSATRVKASRADGGQNSNATDYPGLVR